MTEKRITVWQTVRASLAEHGSMTAQEISERTGIAIGTVKSCVSAGVVKGRLVPSGKRPSTIYTLTTAGLHGVDVEPVDVSGITLTMQVRLNRHWPPCRSSDYLRDCLANALAAC